MQKWIDNLANGFVYDQKIDSYNIPHDLLLQLQKLGVETCKPWLDSLWLSMLLNPQIHLEDLDNWLEIEISAGKKSMWGPITKKVSDKFGMYCND